MSNRGFKGFRSPEQIASEQLEASLKRMDLEDRYIYWTGNPYKQRAASLRSNALACLTEKKRPISMKTWILRAASCVDKDQRIGYKPERVREGLYLHRNSKPAVFFELIKNAAGDFVSANDVPNADGYPKGLKKGEVVVASAEPKQKALPSGKGKAPQIEGPKPEVTTDHPQA